MKNLILSRCEKAEKQHRGYFSNVTEASGEEESIVINYQYEQNTYSDSQFMKNALKKQNAASLVEELDEITTNNKVDYAVVYGEFMYQAASWPYARRVVCKVEKPSLPQPYS